MIGFNKEEIYIIAYVITGKINDIIVFINYSKEHTK